MSDQKNESVRPSCPCGCPKSLHVGEIGCPCALPGEGPCRTEYDRGYDAGYHDREQDCGVTCADRVAVIKADRDHWKAHAQEAGDGFTRVCLDYARVSARNVALVEALEAAGVPVPHYPPDKAG